MAMKLSVCMYFPLNPKLLFGLLDQVTDEMRANTEFLLWVDNNDHKTSSEFYELRKYIRKGLNVKPFINPAVESETEVFDFLTSKAVGEAVIKLGIVDAVIALAFQKGANEEA